MIVAVSFSQQIMSSDQNVTKSKQGWGGCEKQLHFHPIEKQAEPYCKITLHCTNSLIVINYSSVLSQQLPTIDAGTYPSHANLIY